MIKQKQIKLAVTTGLLLFTAMLGSGKAHAVEAYIEGYGWVDIPNAEVQQLTQPQTQTVTVYAQPYVVYRQPMPVYRYAPRVYPQYRAERNRLVFRAF
jgi:hypothetical protein